jgi:type II secretion system protein G
MFHRNMKKLKGFTLIELLLVLAIIGVLTAFLMANFIGAKARARDAQRKSDLRQIQSAFELYRADQGSYPTAALFSCGSQLTAGSTTYMQKIPCDPLSTNPAYTYTPAGTPPTTYTLRACLENANDAQKDATNTCGTGVSYTVSNP